MTKLLFLAHFGVPVRTFRVKSSGKHWCLVNIDVLNAI